MAVKQLDRNGLQGSREFFVEVLMASVLQHPNLVKLVGYCAEGDQRLLVYEYMANGSLENHLLGIDFNSINQRTVLNQLHCILIKQDKCEDSLIISTSFRIGAWPRSQYKSLLIRSSFLFFQSCLQMKNLWIGIPE